MWSSSLKHIFFSFLFLSKFFCLLLIFLFFFSFLGGVIALLSSCQFNI
jgi:hypothetical protein